VLVLLFWNGIDLEIATGEKISLETA
jgi:hypothetical protein